MIYCRHVLVTELRIWRSGILAEGRTFLNFKALQHLLLKNGHDVRDLCVHDVCDGCGRDVFDGCGFVSWVCTGFCCGFCLAAELAL